MGDFIPGASKSKTTSSSSSTPTFNSPEAQTTLASLMQRQANPDQFGGDFLNYFRNNLKQDPGRGNPFIQQTIDAQRPRFESDVARGMAEIRSGGSRGGRGRSEMNQGGFVGDAANQFAANAAGMFASQYNQDRALQQQSASMLQGFNSEQRQGAMMLLSMLRGEEGTGTSKTKGFAAPTFAELASMPAALAGSK